MTTDVVEAYKGVVKEKEALEASIQALSNSKQEAPAQDPLNVSHEVILKK